MIDGKLLTDALWEKALRRLWVVITTSVNLNKDGHGTRQRNRGVPQGKLRGS